jgi:dolichol-phosphate mannosyltransferase
MAHDTVSAIRPAPLSTIGRDMQKAIETPTLLNIPTGALRLDPSGVSRALRLSVVVPTFNESRNIAELVRRLSELLDERLSGDYEIIVVDDNSPDRTWELALTLGLQYPALRVMRRELERGLSTAVIRGWQAARGEILAVIDADLQHPPEVVLDLWDQIERGADLAVASRHIEGGGVSDWSVHRRILSRSAQMLGLAILPSVVGRVSDPMSGYFMFKRACVEAIELNPLGYKILIELLGRARVRWIGEVPYVFRERVEGSSKVTAKVYVEYFRHLIRLRLSTLPVNRFVRFATVGFSGVIVDMGLLFLLSDPSMLGLGLTRSKLIAAEMAIINNFFWNDSWTFSDVSRSQQAPIQRLRRFAKFQLICLAGLVLNTVLLNLLFNLVGMNRYLANAIAIVAVTGWNFWLNLKLSWRVATP